MKFNKILLKLDLMFMRKPAFLCFLFLCCIVNFVFPQNKINTATKAETIEWIITKLKTCTPIVNSHGQAKTEILQNGIHSIYYPKLSYGLDFNNSEIISIQNFEISQGNFEKTTRAFDLNKLTDFSIEKHEVIDESRWFPPPNIYSYLKM